MRLRAAAVGLEPSHQDDLDESFDADKIVRISRAQPSAFECAVPAIRTSITGGSPPPCSTTSSPSRPTHQSLDQDVATKAQAVDSGAIVMGGNPTMS